MLDMTQVHAPTLAVVALTTQKLTLCADRHVPLLQTASAGGWSDSNARSPRTELKTDSLTLKSVMSFWRMYLEQASTVGVSTISLTAAADLDEESRTALASPPR